MNADLPTHARGCRCREAACSCGLEDRVEAVLAAALTWRAGEIGAEALGEAVDRVMGKPDDRDR